MASTKNYFTDKKHVVSGTHVYDIKSRFDGEKVASIHAGSGVAKVYIGSNRPLITRNFTGSWDTQFETVLTAVLNDFETKF